MRTILIGLITTLATQFGATVVSGKDELNLKGTCVIAQGEDSVTVNMMISEGKISFTEQGSDYSEIIDFNYNAKKDFLSFADGPPEDGINLSNGVIYSDGEALGSCDFSEVGHNASAIVQAADEINLQGFCIGEGQYSEMPKLNIVISGGKITFSEEGSDYSETADFVYNAETGFLSDPDNPEEGINLKTGVMSSGDEVMGKCDFSEIGNNWTVAQTTDAINLKGTCRGEGKNADMPELNVIIADGVMTMSPIDSDEVQTLDFGYNGETGFLSDPDNPEEGINLNTGVMSSGDEILGKCDFSEIGNNWTVAQTTDAINLKGTCRGEGENADMPELNVIIADGVMTMSPIDSDEVQTIDFSFDAETGDLYNSGAPRDRINLNTGVMYSNDEIMGKCDFSVESTVSTASSSDTAKNSNFKTCGKLCDINWLKSATVEDLKTELKAGARLFIRDGQYGASPLHWVISSELANPDFIQILLDAGADVNLQNNKGETPLHNAVRYGTPEITEMLLRSGADSQIRNKALEFPFDIAQTNNAFQSTETLKKLEMGKLNAPKINTKCTKLCDGEWLDNASSSDVMVQINALSGVNGKGSEFGATALHWAASYGNIEAVKLLLEKGADATARDNDGITPLHDATYDTGTGTEIIVLLVDYGADLQAPDNAGLTPLHAAANNGNAEAIGRLLILGAEVNAIDDEGQTPLHKAAGVDDDAALTYLLQDGADIQAIDFDGNTPLHSAVIADLEYRDLTAITNTIKVLLNADADPRAQNNNGETAFAIAQTKSAFVGTEGLKLLREATLDSKCNKLCDYDWWKTALPYDVQDQLERVNVMAKNDAGETPLHWAALMGNTDSIIVLLDAGADVRAASNYHLKTPLHMAVVGQIEENVPENVQYLLDAYADVTAVDKTGSTPLHLAAGLSIPETVQILLDAGAEINAVNNNGETPLHRATVHGNARTILSLLSAGADTKAKTTEGKIPWDIALNNDKLKDTSALTALRKATFGDEAQKTNSKCDKLCSAGWWKSATLSDLRNEIAAGANLNAKGEYDETPLHWAAMYGNDQLIMFLLTPETDINLKDKTGFTALHWAAMGEPNNKVIELLLSVDADPKAETDYGKTPLDLALGNEKFKGSEALKTLRGATPSKCENLCNRDWWTGALFSELQEEIASGVDVNAKGSEYDATPLHWAAWLGNSEEVRLLLDAGASTDINMLDRFNWTPLQWAAYGNPDNLKIEILLNAGADPSNENKDGKTALNIAEENEKFEGSTALETLRKATFGQMASKCKDLCTMAWWQEATLADLQKEIARGVDVNARGGQSNATPLHWAAYLGNPEKVKVLLDAGADINAIEDDDWTPLQWAAYGEPDNQKIETLLNAGADPLVKNNEGQTALDVAEANEKFEGTSALETLRKVTSEQTNSQCENLCAKSWWEKATLADLKKEIARGVDVNAKVNQADATDVYRATPIHWAAWLGNKEKVKLLLDAGSEVNARAKGNWTPLQWAAYGEPDNQKIEALLNAGADPLVKNNEGQTALDVAEANEKFEGTEALETLRRAALDQTTTECGNLCTSDWWSEATLSDLKRELALDPDLKAVDSEYGGNPLHWAAWKGNKEKVMLILEAGGDINAKANGAWTVLHWAAVGKPDNQKIETLLNAGADPKALNEDGNTAWKVASGYERFEGTEALETLRKATFEQETIECGNLCNEDWWNEATLSDLKKEIAGNPDLTLTETEYGGAAIHYAAWLGNSEKIQLLLDAGADVNAKAGGDWTALQWAAVGEPDNQKILTLLKGGADPTARNAAGDNAWDIARKEEQFKDTEALETLRRAAFGENISGCVNLCSEEWWYEATVSDLKKEIARGADVNARSSEYDDTPLHWAAWLGNKTQVELLLDAGAEVNATDNGEWTPLHWAAVGKPDNQKILTLLNAGADPLVKNVEGETAFNIAEENENHRYKGTNALETLRKATFEQKSDNSNFNNLSLEGICDIPEISSFDVVVAQGKITFTANGDSEEYDFFIDPKTGFLTDADDTSQQIDIKTGWIYDDGEIIGKCDLKEGKSSNQGAKAFPIEAGSWGGKVRSGPGTNYKQIGSLKNGDVVQLLENTREMMDGYPWFKIQHGDGKVGYQHGSILCAYDQEMKGIYSICEIDNRPQKASENTSQASSEIKGCSCGGKVRSGPGSNNKQIGSLSNGAPIYLLEREKSWYKISYDNGKIGFQWQELMCTYPDKRAAGVEACCNAQGVCGD